jgi:hypothetical protein
MESIIRVRTLFFVSLSGSVASIIEAGQHPKPEYSKKLLLKNG